MNGAVRNFFFGVLVFPLLLVMNRCSSSHKMSMELIDSPALYTDSRLLEELFAAHPAFFDPVIGKKEELNVQVIYTEIRRDGTGHPIFTDHYFHITPGQYFYPASTVKLPVVLLALQRLNEMHVKGVDKYTTMITGKDAPEQTAVEHDSTSATGKPSVAHYIKKILLVSDNDAFNRLYEFLGQEYINESLRRMGYKDAQIIHRLSVVPDAGQNRHTNPVTFLDSADHPIYQQPARKSGWRYTTVNTHLGKGYVQGNELISEPFDFSQKNRLSLTDLHMIMRSVIFPGSVPEEKRFNLTGDDYSFLYRYMSMYPRESDFPFYNQYEYPDGYVKKFLPVNDSVMAKDIRVFSKSGTAYGFLTDVAYIKDERNRLEFFLTATIYCNSDGIFNDDKYDYDTVGYPFLKHLAEVIYAYELGKIEKNQNAKPGIQN